MNSADEDGHTPMLLALVAGHKDIAELLIANGADASVMEAENERMTQRYKGMSFEELVEELVVLCQKGYNWAMKRGFPAMEEYPQYEAVMCIGQAIFDKAGYSGMQDACQVLCDRVIVREGGGQYLAEHSWAGIGGWMP